MKTQMESRKFHTIALVAVATVALTLATAAPALAGPSADLVGEMQVVELAPEMIDLSGVFANMELIQGALEEAPITDGGGWEMVPIDEDAIPSAGDDEPAVGPDEPIEDGGADEGVPETQEDTPDQPGEQADEPDEPTEEVDEPDQPAEETDEPQASTEPTPTTKPNKPAGEPSLPFTGGNATPYAVGGLLVALAGVAVLIAKRRVFESN